MLLAADVIPADAVGWVVGLLATGVLSVLGFLVKNAFGKVESGLETLNGKLDALKDGIARGDGDRRVLEARLHAIERVVERLEEQMRELAEGKAR